MKKIIFLLFTTSIVLIDQIIKFAVVSNIKLESSLNLIPDLLSITYIQNTGAAFGMLKGHTILFVLICASAVITALFFFFKTPAEKIKTSYAISISLIIGGGIGNLVDRIQTQYVIDYIHISFFPAIFNFADIAVVIGSILFMICTIRRDDKNFNKNIYNRQIDEKTKN